MNPRMVLVINGKGVQVVRLVAQNDLEERASYSLYQKVRPFLSQINRELNGSEADREKTADCGGKG